MGNVSLTILSPITIDIYFVMRYKSILTHLPCNGVFFFLPFGIFIFKFKDLKFTNGERQTIRRQTAEYNAINTVENIIKYIIITVLSDGGHSKKWVRRQKLNCTYIYI